MQTFDGALFKLYVEGRISHDEAIKNADSANNLRLRIKMYEEGKKPKAEAPEVEGKSGSSAKASGGLSLSLESIEDEEEEVMHY